MSRTGVDMARSVRPAMALAVLRELGPRAGAAGQRAERLLGDGLPVPERLHARLTAALAAARGWPALLSAAERLLAGDPLLAALPGCADLARLLDRARLVEPWFHAGHRTARTIGESGLTVRHVPALGGEPGPAESLLVCAIDVVATAGPAGRAARVEVRADGAAGRPEEVLRAGAARVAGWRLHWSAPPAVAAAPHPLETARARFAHDPAHPWRLGETAALLGLSPRTLQRGLADAGTSFRAELLGVRLEVAGQLTARTALPLAEVAAAAGFTDHAHLTRRFRARFGCPPSEFRRAGGQ
ncbi:AraC-type DNA-binding protein [Streptomyces sp. TLI_053]|uniref:helix-turn-helix transcriptional regulator n=1 Tax=Streptomyces sp. TLI_053 TaxID=1855352 RepID=UPI00087B497D|nr:AraC family transcriptional regulator [Streptomyces sp. TLI_053]SDT81629.1 AraC-type DNA-binding protein [Streptomyces sp. TLI_053]